MYAPVYAKTGQKWMNLHSVTPTKKFDQFSIKPFANHDDNTSNCTVTLCMLSCSFNVISAMQTELQQLERYLHDDLGIGVTTTPWRGKKDAFPISSRNCTALQR